VIPLYDCLPARRFPVVNTGLVVANFAVFLCYELPNRDNAITQASFYPCDVTNSCHLGLPWGVSWITSMFMHANWHHILGNMVYLLVFGKNVECAFGWLGYLGLYLAGGVAATVLQTATTLFFGTSADAQEANLGASGAIAAVLGAYIVLYPKARVAGLVGWRPFVSPAWLFLGFWFVFQLFEAGIGLRRPDTTSGSGVAFFAHVGGFVFGVLVAVILTCAGRITAASTTDVTRAAPVADRGRPETGTNMGAVRCWVCQHVQAVPVGQKEFRCEQCNAHLQRRTKPANTS
jgi:membrane associated rhomboid family serine protease